MRFPDGFLWGAGTAAYQIEGAATADGRGPSIWDTFSHTPGKTVRGDTGDVAADHYHRLADDLDLMVALGLRAYRFSVSWPRIQPDGRGPTNQPGLDHYRRLVDGLLARGIVPMLTLYHWDLPQALQDRGGWTNRETADRFADYAAVVFAALGDRVPFWITLNEPWCAAFVGHHLGTHAPGLTDEAAALAATHHLLLGHGKALRAMRDQAISGADLGITLSLAATHPASPSPADAAAARRVDGTENRLYLDPLFRARYPADMIAHYRPVSDFAFVAGGDLDLIAAPLDFLGVNYYLRHTIGADPRDPERGTVILPPTGPTTAVGIGIAPDGLTDVLLRVCREYAQLPLYVTENGVALHDYVDPEGRVNDAERVAFVAAHLRAAHEAIALGADLRGYFAWSFLDTFEWAEGFSKRYGIVHVDHLTQTRTPKRSALWFRDVIARNGLA